MAKRRQPIQVNLGWRDKICSILTFIIICIASIVLIVSGLKILWEYHLLLLGQPLSKVQEMALNYSITIFVGSALFLLVYQPQAKAFVEGLLRVKKDLKLLPRPPK